jgi:hypothetical protein
LILLGLVALAIIGCSGGDDEQSESTVAPALTSTVNASTYGDTGTSDTGTLEVRVTDAPDPSITPVYVTTDNSGGGSSGGIQVTQAEVIPAKETLAVVHLTTKARNLNSLIHL